MFSGMPMLLSEFDSVIEGEMNMSLLGDPFTLESLNDMLAADTFGMNRDWLHHEWDNLDESAPECHESFDDRLSHDCMWYGTCDSDYHRENRTFPETRFMVKTNSVKSVAEPSVNSSSNTSRCENNSSIAGSSSASIVPSTSNGVVRTVFSSNSVSKVSNACVINSNNVVNSSINSSVGSSNKVIISNPLVERTKTSVAQKQTIQVPSVGGPRRAGVTVQKTVARSLLIKSTNPPAMPPAITRPCYQADSEDDPCPLDLPLQSVLLNSFLLDNIKPPQGDLWDDVMAAVEEETAAGLSPETPPPSSKASSDSESCDENSLQPPASFPMITPSVVAAVSSASSSTRSSASDSPASVVNDDHSYHSSAKYQWQRRIDDLGVQTPSDSEEEIDVVSTFERSSNCSSGRSSSCSSPGSYSDSSSMPDKRRLVAESQELQLAATKLLSEASRAVSKRLRLKITTTAAGPKPRGAPRGAPRGRPPTKRRISDVLDDDSSSSVTRLPAKKAKAHGGRYKKPRYSEEFGDRRRLHNNMERMRRVDLRNSFEDLRGLVPSLMNKERAPKVLILQDAANYCTELRIQSKQLSCEVYALKKEQDRLRATVSRLRRSLAAHR
ncbi:ubiquitin carboxyl-terminal hydrolase 36 [Nilaparvata lugens]|uniref:ubiquitin carboxyl-terminal hydrolase 36 n=1 Tax=Nilaparvata lugens TaxID=108931 RepID=UPI00193D6C6C|nr:ubiquitin carboxyl-terminal hydrolase 36 [Nilaparvata lugens]